MSDVAHPHWRGSAVGTYRLWRDGGYAVRAITAGIIADALGLPAAIAVIGSRTFMSGAVVAGVMYETLPNGLEAAPAPPAVATDPAKEALESWRPVS